MSHLPNLQANSASICVCIEETDILWGMLSIFPVGVWNQRSGGLADLCAHAHSHCTVVVCKEKNHASRSDPFSLPKLRASRITQSPFAGLLCGNALGKAQKGPRLVKFLKKFPKLHASRITLGPFTVWQPFSITWHFLLYTRLQYFTTYLCCFWLRCGGTGNYSWDRFVCLSYTRPET